VFTGIFTKITISWDRQLAFNVSKEISEPPFKVVTEEIASNIRRLSLVLRQQNFRNDYQSTRCRTTQDHPWIEVVERDVEWPFLWTHVWYFGYRQKYRNATYFA